MLHPPNSAGGGPSHLDINVSNKRRGKGRRGNGYMRVSTRKSEKESRMIKRNVPSVYN